MTIMQKFLDRIDTFLGLFDRYVKATEEGVAIDREDCERARARDEMQAAFLERHAEAAENIASTTHAQTAISRKTADAIARSVPPEGYDRP